MYSFLLIEFKKDSFRFANDMRYIAKGACLVANDLRLLAKVKHSFAKVSRYSTIFTLYIQNI